MTFLRMSFFRKQSNLIEKLISFVGKSKKHLKNVYRKKTECKLCEKLLMKIGYQNTNGSRILLSTAVFLASALVLLEKLLFKEETEKLQYEG